MTAAHLPLLVAVPLLAAGVLTVWRRPAVQRTVLLGTGAAALAAGVSLLLATRDGSVLAHNVALWREGVSIPFVADTFSALMVTTTALLVLVCSAFGLAVGEDRSRYFAPLVLVLSAGVFGALLTGDLFNLFVFVEVMLLPSYGLLAMTGTLSRIRGGRIYVTVNLLTSTIFLAGVALVYGVAGTVHLGELAGAAKESPLVATGAAVVLIALSIKASVVPVHGWLTRTYPATSVAVTALFSGLHTKVAIYAIYRIYAVVFDGEQTYLWIAVTVVSLTMLIGVLGAVGEDTTRSILVFHMISQIGYILLGVALFSQLGLMAGIFYLVHHMIVKASLFLSTGAVEYTHGTSRLEHLGGLARREPLLAVVFMGAALSLAGLPPFSGFVAKLTLVMAALDAGQWAAAATAVAVSLITLMSMLKIWGGVFWGTPPEERQPDADARERDAVAGGSTPGDDSGRDASGSGDAHGPAADGAGGADGAVTDRGSGDDTAPEDARGAGTATATVGAPATGGAAPATGTATAPRVRPLVLAPALVLTLATLTIGLGATVLLDLSATAAAGLLDPSAYLEAVISL